MSGGRVKGTTKTGGRQAGTPNKITADLRAALTESERIVAKELSEAQLQHISPKEVLLRVMRSAVKAGNLQLAMTAAERAAPYVHARLQATHINANVRRGPADFSDAELLAIAGTTADDDRYEGEMHSQRKLPSLN